MRICVIGCGAAGLAVLRVLSEKIELRPSNWKLYGFERTNSVGGVWNYDLNVDKDFISPMYEELRTNLPKEVMAYPDFPFSKEFVRSFIHHSDVIKYLKDYATTYNLNKYIEFNSNIKNVEPIITDGKSEWSVSITNTLTHSNETKIFDIVIVSNGHFEQAFIPDIKGIENFKGEYLHSKLYRVAEKYKDKTVFVLGAKNSGTDIAYQLTRCARKVYLSHNLARLKSRRFVNLIQETYGISEIDEDGLVCTVDGNKYQVDVVIFCTGYTVSFDFLSESCHVQDDHSYIRPLYKNMISPYYPKSLFFVGIAYEIIPFTFFYLQSKVIRAILQNCSKGISFATEDLFKDISKEKEKFETSNVEMRHRHYFNRRQWPYFSWCVDVAEEIMTARIPRHLEFLFDIVKKWRSENVDLYREINFEIDDSKKLGFSIKNGPIDDFYTADFNDYLKNT